MPENEAEDMDLEKDLEKEANLGERVRVLPEDFMLKLM